MDATPNPGFMPHALSHNLINNRANVKSIPLNFFINQILEDRKANDVCKSFKEFLSCVEIVNHFDAQSGGFKISGTWWSY